MKASLVLLIIINSSSGGGDGSGSGSDSTSNCDSSSKILTWTDKYKFGARAGKRKLGARVGKYKLGVRVGCQGQDRGSSKGPRATKYKGSFAMFIVSE